MRSSFFEFHVATTGLFTARGGLEVTSHNIANASTEGYSRQYAEVRTSNPLSFFNGKGMIGTGSEVYGIGQVRDFYLDKKFWSERPVQGEYQLKSTHLSLLESNLNELGDTGTKSYLNNFFGRLQDLKTNSGDDTYRVSFIKSAESLTKLINTTASALQKQQNDLNAEVKTKVDFINTLGTQIRNLNQQIYKYEADGSKANDLRDRRALLIDELSRHVNIEVTEREYNSDYERGLYPEPEDRGKSDKRLSITINGHEFVTNDKVSPLEVVQRTSRKNYMDVDGLYDIQFKGTKVKFDIYDPKLKGELKGLIDMRDGNNSVVTIPGETTTNYKGIPHYLNKLNTFVRTFAKAFNEGKDLAGNKLGNIKGHVDGYDKNGNKGEQFFTKNGAIVNPNYSDLNCLNFQVNTKILDDPSLIAASSNGLLEESNNEILLSLLEINNYSSLFKEGKLGDYIIGISSELGIDKKQSDNFSKNYTEVISAIDNERISAFGVDVNEETINMIRYNQLYQAAAKLINIIDGIYDTCINRLGV